MSKLDYQHRLTIPKDIFDLVSISSQSIVSINYDFENNSLYLDTPAIEQLTACVGIRSLDTKHRICLSQNILDLISADYSSEFIVYIRYGYIHISKMQKKPDA